MVVESAVAEGPRRRALEARLQHVVGQIDDAAYTAVLRISIDELSGAAVELRTALGPARNLPLVVAALHELDEHLGRGLRGCEAGLPADAGREVESAERCHGLLADYAHAVQEIAAVHTALDDALRSAGITAYRNLPTFHGLYRAVDVVGRRLVAEGKPRRALGIAQTARRELTALLERHSGATHTCRACRGAALVQLDDDAARFDALRAAGYDALANRLACDLAARRERSLDGVPLPRVDGSGPHAPDALMLRSARIAEQARTCAEQFGWTEAEAEGTAGKEKEG